MSVIPVLRRLSSAIATRTMLLGVAVGFGGLCWLGRITAGQSHLTHFVRFTEWTSPETNYYPTVGEMMATVRARMQPGQILVIVGGNSILRGAGQPAGQVWTQRLQTELGVGYGVFNFAFDGSGITDGGAVVAEALRREYPRQVYIANAAPGQPPAPDGTGVYRFMFWEAYYKGLLIADPARAAAIEASNENLPVRNPPGEPSLQELRTREWLDQFCYFQDLWNRVTYKDLNLVWGFYMRDGLQFLRARKRYADPEPDSTTFPLDKRYNPSNLAIELANVRGCSQFAYMSFSAAGNPQMRKDASGRWPLYRPFWDQFVAGIRTAMPDELKPRTLVLLSRSSPYYIRRLSADERERDDLTYRHGVEVWKAEGYDAMDYGSDFNDDDYGDRTHLTRLGGAKLARQVADKVRAMAGALHYTRP